MRLLTLPGVTAGMAGGGQWARLLHYMNLPGTLPFFGAALAISPALFFSRRLNRARLVLLLGTFLFCLASFLLVFHSWSRYIMPLFPLAALLLGIAADRIQLSLGPRLGPLLAMAAAAVLLALMSGISVTGLETEQDREQYLGMITPDRRAYRGYPRAISKLLPFGPDVVMVRDSFKTLIRTHAVEDLWYFSGHKAVSMEQEELKAKSRLGETLSVLLIRLDPKAELTTQSVDRAWPTPDPNHHDISYPARWFLAYPEREHLLTAFDASGVAYSAFRVKTYANQPIP